MVARQNGKTTLVEVKILWKLYVKQVKLVISTAQDLDQAEESWQHGVEIAESIPELAADIEHVVLVNGKKTLKLRARRDELTKRMVGGGRWKVKASTKGAGRGLSGDDINLDELREHDNWRSWSAVTKTTMARPYAQVWGYSNAGEDKSVVLNTLQEKGRAAAADPSTNPSFGLFEYSAPQDCAPDDESFWPMANPSLGYPGGVDLEALREAQRTDPEATWRTECLCQHVPDLLPPVIAAGPWLARAGATERPEGRVAFAIGATWPDADQACIGIAGRAPSGGWLVQLAEHGAGVVQREGTAWIVDWLTERCRRHRPVGVVLDPGGSAGFLKDDIAAVLRPLGVPLLLPSLREVAHAAGQFRAAVVDEPTVRHYSQPELDAAVMAGKKQQVGNAWTWLERDDIADVSPVKTVSLALWAAVNAPAPTVMEGALMS